MGASIKDGPQLVYGDLGNLLNAAGQGQANSVVVPDPNSDSGPSIFFQGDGLPDIRYFFPKDKVQGYTGIVPAHLAVPYVNTVDAVPAAFQVNNVAAAQAVVNGAAMTLAGASTGITPNVPIIPFAGFGGLNGAAVVTTGLALDFGFAFGTVVIGSLNVTVADSTLFQPGMPLVIGGVGNAAGTTCLLTNVTGITSGTVITIADAPLASNAAAPIGTGNLWGPSENGYPTPTAALPYRARGPGLFFDPEQGLARAISIAGTAGGCSGGNFLVTAYDQYGMLWTQLVTVAAGANTGYTKKCAKYVVSIVPQFTDGANTYTAGTADIFEFGCRASRWEFTGGTCWNGVAIPTNVGFLAPDTTNPATNLTGDVRGVVQVGVTGAGTPITAAASSDGAIVGLVMTGKRLTLFQSLSMSNVVRGTVTNTISIYGSTQV